MGMILICPTETITVESIEVVESSQEGSQLIARTRTGQIYILKTGSSTEMLNALSRINKMLVEKGSSFPIGYLE